MALSGIGQNPELPIKNQTEQTKSLSQNVDSIWAQFNDFNNEVDESDVKYKEGAKQSSVITKFLQNHKGETWTDALKSEFNKILTHYNNECEAELSLDPLGDFTEFEQTALNRFENFKNGAEDDFEGFKEEAEEKIMNFKAGAVKEQKQFVNDSIKTILDDLKNGYSGYVEFDRIGKITYDDKLGAFMLERVNGDAAALNDEKLAKIIELALDYNVNITGRSKKVTVD